MMSSHKSSAMNSTRAASERSYNVNGTPRSMADYCGWLWMRGSIISRWRQRYFNLSMGMLSYFDTFPSEEFLKQANAMQQSITRVISLEGTQPRGVLRVAHVEETNHPLGFKVYGTNGKVIEVRAPRTDEQRAWLTALRPVAIGMSRSWSGHDGDLPQMYQFEDEISKLSSPGILNTYEVPLHGFAGRESIPIDKRGWFLKRSDYLRRWNRYFFVIQGRMLSYYATDKPYEVPRRRGYIQTVRRTQSKTHKTTIFIVKLDSGTELYLRAPKEVIEEEMDDWFECLMTNAMVYHSSKTNDFSTARSLGSTSLIA